MCRLVATGAVLIAGLALAAPRLKDPPPHPSIVGEWVNEFGVRHVFGDNGTVQVGDKPPAVSMTFAVNPRANPAEVELTQLAQKMTWRGIYKIEGDTLTFCLRPQTDVERPTKFERSDTPFTVLMVLKRVGRRD